MNFGFVVTSTLAWWLTSFVTSFSSTKMFLFEHTVNWFTWCCSDNITNNMFVVMHGKSTQFKRIGNNRKVEYRFVVVNWSVKLRVSYFWMKCLDTASRKVIAGWLLGIENKRMGLYVRGNFHTSIQAVSSYVASEPVS